MSVGDYIRESQIWKSVFRHPAPYDRRNRVVVMLTNFFLHLHPVSIKQNGIALSYTWCMGGITFFLFLAETITGVLLMFYYRPTLEWAFNDILALRDVTTLGVMREIHRWGAHAPSSESEVPLTRCLLCPISSLTHPPPQLPIVERGWLQPP